MITTSTKGVWWVDDVYKKVNKGVYVGAPALFSWGYNANGQLGQNNRTYRSSPVQIPGTQWNNISTGYQLTCSTKTDGTLWAWGVNTYGELGQNNTISYSSPVQIPGTTWNNCFASGFGNYLLATKTDGTLWSWGYNAYGQLGQNNRTQYSSPVQIPGTSWSYVSNNYYQAGATKTDGTLWAWGYNANGQLGQNNRIDYSSPVQIPGTQWNKIQTGGSNFTIATKTNGTLWTWGANDSGQLGQNNTIQYSSPVQIPGTQWNEISQGEIFSNFALATKTDGTLWAWGTNQSGRLGQNNTTQYSSPVQIPGTSWSSISGGGAYSLAKKTDGTLWSWGSNSFGQLGQNNTIQYSSPVQIPGTQWNKISAGYTQSMSTFT